MNNEKKEILLQGVVRPRDIAFDNSVLIHPGSRREGHLYGHRSSGREAEARLGREAVRFRMALLKGRHALDGQIGKAEDEEDRSGRTVAPASCALARRLLRPRPRRGLSVRDCESARIKDIANINGVRPNVLIGYGLVVGLNRTGDKVQTIFTNQTLAEHAGKNGDNCRPDGHQGQ